MAAGAVFVLLAIAMVFVFTLGLGPLAIVALALALGVGIWAVVGFLRGVTPERALRGTQKADLLGPGGPDDPDRNR